MPDLQDLLSIIDALERWVRERDYAGIDPFDALNGRRLPASVRAHARTRQAVIQAGKRSPIDLRPVLGVSPRRMAKALGVVASEIPGPVGAEFRQVSDKMKIGRTMDAALQETADRLGTPEFQFFVITLQIQRETGGNLAETLSNLADVLRKRMQMKLKIKAMSSESKASAYIIGALPFIVFVLIYQINYAYMSQFFTDPRLIATGLGGMVWMGIGAFVMRQMINFEI